MALRVGAGTKLKIIESMALGTPVVSTSKGAEGLEVKHGENNLIADPADEFIQAVLFVLHSPEFRRKLVVGGQNLITKNIILMQLAKNTMLFWSV
jgi:glycosyltransferase involved in cell wall biosynthesis